MGLRRRRDLWDVLIVGGGIAGLTAACNAARRGLPTALFEAGGGCGGQIANVNALDDWPAVTQSSGVALTAALVDEACRWGAEIAYQPVRSVMTSGKALCVNTEQIKHWCLGHGPHRFNKFGVAHTVWVLKITITRGGLICHFYIVH